MTSILDQQWACMNCNTTFRLGQMYTGPLASDPLQCPNCRSGNTSPADGVAKAIPEYFGEVGTRN